MYNKPGEDVTIMANSLEKFFLAKVKMMPPVEVDLTQQMMTKKNDPPKKVLPPGSSHNALTNSTNKMVDSKTTPSKSAQLGLSHESFTQSAGVKRKLNDEESNTAKGISTRRESTGYQPKR